MEHGSIYAYTVLAILKDNPAGLKSTPLARAAGMSKNKNSFNQQLSQAIQFLEGLGWEIIQDEDTRLYSLGGFKEPVRSRSIPTRRAGEYRLLAIPKDYNGIGGIHMIASSTERGWYD